VGLDSDEVAAYFTEFARKHPMLTAKQTRFLGLLQNHIARFGSITLDRLYEQPFTVVDADGLDGVFVIPEEIDDLLDILSVFEPPVSIRSDQPELSKRTKQ
jgi:type I restriction enzyme R subunit